ncbi:MAG TPA: Uma2 family endonuclease [Gemmataceae bacterium]|jgi:Uma2 family endonuclease|nr:Uma2 family endonuclease [Gemmataceae bacterium]
MATVPSLKRLKEPFYIESDGRPMGETPLHGDNLAYLVQMLRVWFADDPRVYVAGNMFVHYVRGERNRHLSPDVFVARGVPKSTTPERRSYRVWEEGKAPDLVIELTSESTREEDMDDKMGLYQDTLRVREYFLFDPYAEYLDPPFQGHRLFRKRYRPIAPVRGRLPSEVLGLHLEPHEGFLRLYDLATRRWLLLPPEERQARLEAEAEVERLKQELEKLRRQPPKKP